ncbi:MAG TPA: NUDIX domain-containing protein [Jiangellaceae bacterium]|nr:NUDIX domain-containing protein [Jiangellaceae bacterium]
MSGSDPANPEEPVIAAGAVVWRPNPAHDGDIEICLVHRPRYDDWSLPKGKLDPGEHLLACAVREVEEETGQRVVLGRPLPTQQYEANGLPKRVHYWAARADDEAPAWTGTREVDKIVFLPSEDAVRRLTNLRDADVVAALLNGEIRTVPFVVLRHTKARKRSSWDGDDRLRPLNERGAWEARSLVAPFTAIGLDRVVSSDAVRCIDSVRPYADAAGVSMEPHKALSEEEYRSQPLGAEKLTRSLLADGARTVVCSHRPVLPEIISAAAEQAPNLAPSEPLHPGDFLIFHHHGGVLLAVERFDI